MSEGFENSDTYLNLPVRRARQRYVRIPVKERLTPSNIWYPINFAEEVVAPDENNKAEPMIVKRGPKNIMCQYRPLD